MLNNYSNDNTARCSHSQVSDLFQTFYHILDEKKCLLQNFLFTPNRSLMNFILALLLPLPLTVCLLFIDSMASQEPSTFKGEEIWREHI